MFSIRILHFAIWTSFFFATLDLVASEERRWQSRTEGNPALFSSLGQHVVRATEAHLLFDIDLQSHLDVVLDIATALTRLRQKAVSMKCGDVGCIPLEPINRLLVYADDLKEELSFLCRGQDCDIPRLDMASGREDDVSAEAEPFAQPLVASRAVEEVLDYDDYACTLHMGFDRCPRDHRRSKRFIAELLGVIGVGMSIYDHEEIRSLAAKEKNEEDRVAHLIHRVDVQQTALHKVSHLAAEFAEKMHSLDLSLYSVEEREAVAELLLDGEIQLNTVNNYLQAIWAVLTQRRLSPKLFSLDGLQHTMHSLRWEVASKGFKLMGTSLTHILDAPLSWIAEDNKIKLFFHLPVVELETWSFYRWMLAPVHYNNGTRYAVAPVGSYLAVSPDGTSFRELTVEDFQSCRRMEGKFVCPAGVTSEGEAGSCLAALFRQSDHIPNICALVRDHSPSESLLQISRNSTVVVPPPESTKTKVTISCVAREGLPAVTQDEWPEGVSLYEIADDCTLSTSRHKFKPRPSWVVTGNLTVKQLQPSHLKELVKKLEQRTAPAEDSEIANAVRELNQTVVEAEQGSAMEQVRENTGVVGSATAIFLLIAVAGSLAYYGKQQLTELYHSVQEVTLDRAAQLFTFRPREDAPQQGRDLAQAAYSAVHGVRLNKRSNEEHFNLV